LASVPCKRDEQALEQLPLDVVQDCEAGTSL
jgi:hypothetical protein